ncbi:hypothetical protein CSOJ01_04548 [Colletotrichum sojae]|uniref:Ankyrin repeat protein n=1 Tax=Colletotrichum sojae TaxID=2175907 RepID=A0A8H6MZ39_9PEZI|nr:hypothetical protein CSOJ01_04548 [Colletotrichum sojae]
MFLPPDAIRMTWLLLGPPKGDIRIYTRPGIKQTILHHLACRPFIQKFNLHNRKPVLNTRLFEETLAHGAGAGLHINIRDAHGDTPLHYVSLIHTREDWQIMDVLLRLGADAGALNDHSKSPITLRGRGLVALSPQSGELNQTENRLTLQRAPLRGFDRMKLKSEEDEHSPRFRVQSGLGSWNDSLMGRVFERLSGGYNVHQVWDTEQQKWLQLPKPVQSRLCVAADSSNSSYERDAGHLFIQAPNKSRRPRERRGSV